MMLKAAAITISLCATTYFAPSALPDFSRLPGALPQAFTFRAFGAADGSFTRTATALGSVTRPPASGATALGSVMAIRNG